MKKVRVYDKEEGDGYRPLELVSRAVLQKMSYEDLIKLAVVMPDNYPTGKYCW